MLEVDTRSGCCGAYTTYLENGEGAWVLCCRACGKPCAVRIIQVSDPDPDDEEEGRLEAIAARANLENE